MGMFSGVTVLITGASAGIGAATAAAFAREGARLILVARRRSRLESLAEELGRAAKAACHVLAMDLRDRDAVTEQIDSLPDQWKAVDVLVNNAGLARGIDSIQESRPQDWDEVLDVNVRGLLAVTRAVLPGMIERNRGHIINLGSIAGWEVYPGGALYCASKHAVRALSRGLKMDLQGTALRVTSIDPGLVETEFSLVRFRGDHERAGRPYAGIKPLSAQDIAEAILWCAARPPHVNIMNMIIFPTAQASSTMVDRRPDPA